MLWLERQVRVMCEQWLRMLSDVSTSAVPLWAAIATCRVTRKHLCMRHLQRQQQQAHAHLAAAHAGAAAVCVLPAQEVCQLRAVNGRCDGIHVPPVAREGPLPCTGPCSERIMGLL